MFTLFFILFKSCRILFYFFNPLHFIYYCGHSQTIKVPISWEAMVKLVDWCYSGELPSPPSGCLWEKIDTEEKLRELKPYVELCWLAEFWLLEEVHEA